MQDMADYRVTFEPPLKTRFADIDVFTCGPWCQGPVLAQALNIVSGFDLRALGHNSPQYIHVLTEALKLAFADRQRYYGDPKFVDVPLDALLSARYADERRKLIDPRKAAPGMPEAGDISGVAAPKQALPRAAHGEPAPLADTSYVCVIDRDGNAFSATPSDGSSSTPVIPGTGLVPVLARLAVVVRSRASGGAGARANGRASRPARRSRCATARSICRSARPATTSSRRRCCRCSSTSTCSAWSLQSAIEAPRFATYSYPSSSEPHAYHPGRLNLESRIVAATGDALAKLGHDVKWWPEVEWRAGAVCAIRVNPDTGVLEGGADPRRPAYALGW